jgi:hypothetical protein
MEDEVIPFLDTAELAELEDIVLERCFKRRRGRKRLGRGKDQLVRAFPAKPARDLRFEGDVLRRVPLLEQGILYQGLVELEDQIAECGDLVSGIGEFQAYHAAVTGIEKRDRKDECQDGGYAKEFTHKRADKSLALLIYKKAVKKTSSFVCGQIKKV